MEEHEKETVVMEETGRFEGKQYICPFCGKAFYGKEIHFVADATENPFHASKADNEPNVDIATPLQRQRTNTSLHERQQAPAAVAHAAAESVEEQQFGVSNADDLIASKNLKKYTSAVEFTFGRKGVFYRVGTKEQAEQESGYGYVAEGDWEGEAPLKLQVPSRAEGSRVITTRLCPHCHCNLPRCYCKPNVQVHTIALAGCSSSGKTQFITMALHDIHDELVPLQLGDVEVAECSRWFLDVYLEQIKYRNGTDSTKKGALFPIVLRVSRYNSYEDHFVIIHDIAGEYAENGDYAANALGFRQATMLLLMLDASSFFSGEANMSENELRCKDQPSTALNRLRELGLCPNCTDIVAVLTKIDSIIYVNEGDSPIVHGGLNGARDGMELYKNKLNVHKNGVRRAVIERIDKEIRERVLGVVAPNINQDLKFAFGKECVDVTFLGVSTKILTEEQGSRAFKLDLSRKTGRHRLVEPLYYVFAKLGIFAWNEEGFDFEEQDLPLEEEPSKGFFARLFHRKDR